MASDPVTVLTLENLSAAFTEKTTEVWCDFADQPANTNFDGATHFCQFCGSTTHAQVGA